MSENGKREGQVTMNEQHQERRQHLLLIALEEAKKWCVAAGISAGDDFSDQSWLQLFSSPSETVTADHVRRFRRYFKLREGWDKQAVASRIMDFRREDLSNV